MLARDLSVVKGPCCAVLCCAVSQTGSDKPYVVSVLYCERTCMLFNCVCCLILVLFDLV